ncbi:hypothetical protein ASZ90_008899 [hydrocarbon metagenome]|uniref:Uncharacterized protein n=1 Tax=hydrocarbon metagenome TaxID=938273 RepID=A0A0W8FKA5_9ZZZZ
MHGVRRPDRGATVVRGIARCARIRHGIPDRAVQSIRSGCMHFPLICTARCPPGPPLTLSPIPDRLQRQRDPAGCQTSDNAARRYPSWKYISGFCLVTSGECCVNPLLSEKIG